MAALVAGCDDGASGTVDAAIVDARADEGTGPVDAGGADAGFRYVRPGPRLATPEILARDVTDVAQLVRWEGRLLAMTPDGWLYRIADGERRAIRRGDLPPRARLVTSAYGLLVASETGGIEPLEGDGPRVEASAGLRAVQAHDGALWWLDDAEGGRLARFELPAGPTSSVAVGLGPATAFSVADDGGAVVGIGGDEPRTLVAVSPGGDVAGLVNSRFVPQALVRSGGAVMALMTTGAGWVERLDEGGLARLGYAPRGSADFRAFGGWVWWRTNAGVYRLRPPDGAPESVRAGVAPSAIWIDADGIFWADAWKREVLHLPLPD